MSERFPRKASFEKWLREFVPHAMIGHSCSSDACPLAAFLNEKFDLEEGVAYVRPDKVARESCWRITHDGSGRQPMPRWANDFARRVDHDVDGYVSAAKAMEILGAKYLKDHENGNSKDA